MSEPEKRLGDLIDDYCPRCKLLLNHAIASFFEGKVVKVICQTCLSEHPFLHGEGAKKKKLPSARASLFDQVLSKVSPTAEPAVEPADEPDRPARKKKSAPSARYISRHKTRPPRKGH
jgi:hypothetical protein